MYRIIVIVFSFFSFANTVFADEAVAQQMPMIPAHTPAGIQTTQNTPVTSNITWESPFGNATITDVLNRLINYGIAIAGSVAAIMILWGAFKIMTSGGDEKKYKDGKQTIIYALGGLLIILLARGLVALFRGLIIDLGA